jgi:hypothetical protein
MKAAFDGPIDPPAHVSIPDSARPFWDSIVRARARNKWTETDYEMAANLARCKADIERIQSEVYAEGDVIENHRGTMVVNPKHTLLETLSRRAVALSRMLHVHAEATVGKAKDQPKGNQLQRDAEETVQKLDDGLIARPH